MSYTNEKDFGAAILFKRQRPGIRIRMGATGYVEEMIPPLDPMALATLPGDKSWRDRAIRLLFTNKRVGPVSMMMAHTIEEATGAPLTQEQAKLIETNDLTGIRAIFESTRKEAQP